MNKLIDLQNIYIDNLKKIYSVNEIKSIFQILIESFLEKKIINIMIGKEDFQLKDYNKIFSFLEELKKGCPVHYIVGFKYFYNCKIKLNKYVLIPRGETEQLVEWILKEINNNNNNKILDICTGSGCIGISLSKNSDCKVIGIDISKEALLLAKENAKINNVIIDFLNFDIKNNNLHFLEKQNIIVSNPPYVLESDKKILHQNVKNFEPHIALFVSDKDPLIFYKKIINISIEKLFKNGFLFLEINEKFESEIVCLLLKNGFKNIELKKDINNKPRLVKAQFM